MQQTKQHSPQTLRCDGTRSRRDPGPTSGQPDFGARPARQMKRPQGKRGRRLADVGIASLTSGFILSTGKGRGVRSSWVWSGSWQPPTYGSPSPKSGDPGKGGSEKEVTLKGLESDVWVISCDASSRIPLWGMVNDWRTRVQNTLLMEPRCPRARIRPRFDRCPLLRLFGDWARLPLSRNGRLRSRVEARGASRFGLPAVPPTPRVPARKAAFLNPAAISALFHARGGPEIGGWGGVSGLSQGERRGGPEERGSRGEGLQQSLELINGWYSRQLLQARCCGKRGARRLALAVAIPQLWINCRYCLESPSLGPPLSRFRLGLSGSTWFW